MCFEQDILKNIRRTMSHKMQGLLDGPAHKYCLNFPTANVCAVTVKSDFILPLPKNTCACTFTSFFYLFLNIYTHFYIN